MSELVLFNPERFTNKPSFFSRPRSHIQNIIDAEFVKNNFVYPAT